MSQEKPAAQEEMPGETEIERIRYECIDAHRINFQFDNGFCKGFDAATEKLYRPALARLNAEEEANDKWSAELGERISALTQENEKLKAALGNMVTEMQVFLDVSHKHHFPDARKAQDEAKEALKGAGL